MAVITIDAAIGVVARRQHGVVTRAQLISMGLTEREIDYRLDRGRLHALHRGVYLVGNPAPAPFARELAAVLACEPDAFLTGASACGVYGMVAPHADRPQVLTVGRSLKRTDVDVRSTGDLNRDDRRTWHAIPIVSPARAIIDYAGETSPHQVAAAIERGQILRLLTQHSLSAAIDRAGRRPGVPLVRDLIADLSFTRSKAERIVLDLIRQAALPIPEVNDTRAGDELDFVWHGLRLILEIDGWSFHATRAAFERDRRRDADHQRAGYTTIRAIYAEITQRPHAFIARLAMAIARAQDRCHFLAA